MSRFDEWLEVPELQNARFTSVFKAQLEALTIGRVVNPFPILDEIKNLEGFNRRPTNTKKATRFKGGLLDGLLHKHYFNARHIPHNLHNHWGQEDGRLERAVAKVGEEALHEDDLWLHAGALADRIVSVAFQHKNLEKSLTGDWIIFKRQNHKNYYLCLATHDESNGEIFDRFAACAKCEFPELKFRGRSA